MSNDKETYRMIDAFPEGAMRLFKVMMRMEFALKETGFCRMLGHVLVVDKVRYANEKLKDDFWKSLQSVEGIIVLFDDPPSHQAMGDAGLSWRKAGRVSSNQELLGAVWRVRNNLFHGGKSGDVDRDRNEALVLAALFVLDAMLKNDPDLLEKFMGQY